MSTQKREQMFLAVEPMSRNNPKVHQMTYWINKTGYIHRIKYGISHNEVLICYNVDEP